VRRSTRFLAWTAALAVAAGAGAFAAAHTDPFPPGVSDPGERPSPTTSVAPEPEPRRWQMSARVRSEHRLHVGGACRSDWDVQVLLEEDAGGRVQGTALATVRGDPGCDFATAAVQTQAIGVPVSGSVAFGGGQLRLRFGEPVDEDPTGSTDLGGFVELVDGFRAVAVPGNVTTVGTRRPDGNDGVFSMTWRIQLRCTAGC
jgi:hypothetical protein